MNHPQGFDAKARERSGPGPIWDIERHDRAKHAGVGPAAMAQRQQQHFEIDGPVVVGFANQAYDRRNLSVGDAFQKPEQGRPIVIREEGAEAPATHFMADQRAKPGSREADRMARGLGLAPSQVR